MYDFVGCQCSACRQTLKEGDDIVVCPDCGAPYHRSCYQEAGACIFSAQHEEGFEWTPPERPSRKTVCTNCGTENPKDNHYCRMCGAPLSDKAAPGGLNAREQARNDAQAETMFQYAQRYAPPGSPFQIILDPNDTMDDIPMAEWAAYIGPASPRYLLAFKQMELLKRKTSVSLSAMLFGPFYFFYRKAWKPAFAFLALELLTNVPALLDLMRVSGNALAMSISDSTLSGLALAASTLSFILMVVRGIFGIYLYKRSAAARIDRIRSLYTDPAERTLALGAQGGTSVLAVLGAFAGLCALGALLSLCLGPNLEAVMQWLYA